MFTRLRTAIQYGIYKVLKSQVCESLKTEISYYCQENDGRLIAWHLCMQTVGPAQQRQLLEQKLQLLKIATRMNIICLLYNI